MNNIQAEVNPILFERVVNNKAEIELPKANDIPTFANFIVPSRCPKTSDGIKAGADVIVKTVNPDKIGTRNPTKLPVGIKAMIIKAKTLAIPDKTIGTNDPNLSNNLPPATLPIKHDTPKIEPATPN